MRVALFMGSMDGPQTHRALAASLATDLARAGIGIVYGGGGVGLMGTMADAALAAGGEVVGVIPRHLIDAEIAHRGLTTLDVVRDMHERKARMASLADAFVGLPGGPGTLEELLEVWTWGQLGLHVKPTAVINVDSFFDPLLAQINTMVDAGYVAPIYRDSLGVVSDATTLARWWATYRHPPSKWSASLHLGARTRP
jgi:uncharacterized protein (TIGR00730 family)